MIEVEEMNITTKNFVPLFRQMLNNLTAAEFRALGESVGLRFREPITEPLHFVVPHQIVPNTNTMHAWVAGTEVTGSILSSNVLGTKPFRYTNNVSFSNEKKFGDQTSPEAA